MGSVWRDANDRSGSLQGGSFEVAFIDTSVDGWQGLADGLPSGIAAVLLDGSSDGLAQMAAWAAGRRDCRAIHILSHGGEGYLQLGSLTLDGAALENRTDDLRTLTAMLAVDSDILLYGCNVAAGDGAAFLDALAGITGANVAASRTLTGAAELGGDWTLGWVHGAVHTQTLQINAWHGVLVPPTNPPQLVSATVSGPVLVLTYDVALDVNNTPANGDFVVTVNGQAVAVNAVFVDGTTVSLTLASATPAGVTVTVSYTDPTANDDPNAIQSVGGIDAASLVNEPVDNNTAPVLQGATVNGTSLVLTYDVALDANDGPATGDFVVMVGGQPVTVTDVAVDSVSKTVTLTLASAAISGATVTVSYTDPTDENDTNAIQSTSGGDAASLTNRAVTNNTPPTLQSATVNGTTLVLTYDVVLDANDGPATGDFVVTVGGQPVTVSDVVVDGFSKKVTLTLATAVPHGATVTVSYTDPTANDDVAAIQSEALIDAASLVNQAVTNNTPDPNGTPPTLDITTVQNPAFNSGDSDPKDLFNGVTASTVDEGQSFTGMVLAVHNVPEYAHEFLTIAGTDIALNDGVSGSLSSGGTYSVSWANGVATVTLSGMELDNGDMGSLIDGLAFKKTDTLAGDQGDSETRPVILRSITDSGATNNVSEVNQLVTVTIANPYEGEWRVMEIAPVEASMTFTAGQARSVSFTVTIIEELNLMLATFDLDVVLPHGWTYDNLTLTNGDGDPVTLSGHSHSLGAVYTLTFDVTGNNDSALGAYPISINTKSNFRDLYGQTNAALLIPETVAGPILQSAAVNGTSLVLTYDVALDANDGPATGDFVVTVGGQPVTISNVTVDSANKTVTLTLANAVANGATVTVSYTDPTSEDDTGVIQSLAGADAASLSNQAVTNNTPAPVPVLQSAAVNGTSLVLTYDVALDANDGLSKDYFAVTVGGQPVTVSGVTVNSANKTVTLTLATAVANGATVTVSYTDPTSEDDTGVIQSLAGADAASLSNQAVTNNTPAPDAPVLQSAAVNGTSLVLTYDVALDANHGPSEGYFAVTVGGQPVIVSGVTVNSANKTVTLTLATAVANGATVTVSYTDPTSENDANAIQSMTGADAASLIGRAVTNNTPAPDAPVLQSAAVNGTSLVLTYDVALDANHGPSEGYFAVTVGGQPVIVSGVTVNSANKTVTLTLATAVANGATVTVSYTDPTSENDANAIQSMTGVDAASLSNQAVSNNTPPAPQPEPGPGPGSQPTETLIDGMLVESTVTTGANGQQSQLITIPVVPPDRVEDRVEGARADIPLITSGGTSLLEAGLPLGVGMRVEAPSLGAQSGEDARLTLIRAIESRTTGTDQQADRAEMTGLGSQFLDTLPTEGNLLVRIVTPTVPSGTVPGAPIVITGSTGSSSHEGGTGPQVALVIDVRGLPPGTVLQLQDVEFAAIIGAITVTGGDGRQVVTGDSHPQIIVLGADDDVLYAGGGDDLVGSAGGNDRIYGEAGNDRLFGGPGDDTLDGGSGIDAARFDGNFADFTITRAGYGVQTVADGRAGSPEGTDSLANVEILRFADGVTLANAPVKVALTEALYLAANQDVRAAVANGTFASGLEHLVRFGQAEGRLAMLAVDEAFYRAENSDVDRAIANGMFSSAADHFARFGAREGRDPNAMFNTDWYLSQNTDVAGAVTSGLTTAWAHYNSFGWNEGRDPSVWFDTSGYLAAYQDVAKAGVNPLIHFVEHGFAENRLAVGNDNGLWVV